MTGVLIFKLDSDEARKQALKMALSMYLGEHCKFCRKEYKTLEDLKDTVWAGYHEHGRLACESCFDVMRLNEMEAR